MAIVSTGSATKYLARTANVPHVYSYTMAGWFKRTDQQSQNAYEVLMINRWDTNTYKSYIGFFPSWEDPNVLGPLIYNAQGGGNASYSVKGTPNTDREPNTTDWYYYAVTSDGTNTKGYFYSWNGSAYTLVNSTVLSITDQNSIGTTADYLNILCDSGDSQYMIGKCCYVRVWDVALTQAEIQAELVSSVIVKTANINTALGACTSSSFANDVSGNGRNWTLGAGLSTSDFDSDIPSGLTSGGNPTPGAGSLTLTGASGSMDTRITPRMARNWVHGLGGILVPA